MPKLAAPYIVRDVSASYATSFDTKIAIGMGSGGPQKPEGNYYRCSNGYTGTNADFDPYNVYYNDLLRLSGPEHLHALHTPHLAMALWLLGK
jgi:hypothetical protein